MTNVLCWPLDRAVAQLEAEGFRVTSDECAIYGFRNIDIEKGDVAAEIVCVPYDYDEYQNAHEKNGKYVHCSMLVRWVDNDFYCADGKRR